MKELFNLLRQKDRKILGFFCLLLLISFSFYFFIARGMRNSYLSFLDELKLQRESFSQTQMDRDDQKILWLKWNEALKDMDDLRDKYFYKEGTVVQSLLQDLDAIFKKGRVQTSRKKYDYAEFKDENIKKVVASFEIAGPYVVLRQFIDAVESFPKFLLIEKIDFVDIDSQTGELKLKLSLAGYYEK